MTITDYAQGVQFTFDQDGQVTAVVLTPELWHKIVDALEDIEDRQLVRALQKRIAIGPQAAGALRWQDVVDEWQ